MSDGQKVTYLGKVDFRNKELTFGIKEKDRTKHMYIIGKSGMGKSTLLENLAIQDIQNGEGLCFIDPHGSTAEKLLDHIPESRIKDVVYFAPFDGEHPIGLNMLEKVSADKRYLVANGLMSAFKKIFTDSDGKGTFSARMEYVLNNIILALLENENQTLLGVNRMLFDKEFRKFIVSNVTDPTVRDFWVNEYANYTEKTAQDLAPAIQNKIGQFVSNPLIRNIIGQEKTSFDIRKIMDEKKILIVNLSKGKVGEGNANLLGSLFITKIYLAAMSRADAGPYEVETLPPFYFYVDEFQNFANESFASILSEARKYKLALTVAHQYVEQMTDEVKAAVFGNVGTMITFRVGATDAEVFEKEFAPYFILDDFVNLSAFQIYLRLMIDSQASKPFSAKTLNPIEKPAHSYVQMVIANSRAVYGRTRFVVEEEVAKFYAPIVIEKKPKKVETDMPTTAQPSAQPYAQTKENHNKVAAPSAAPYEKVVQVRKIRDDTPLPPRSPLKKETVVEESAYEKRRAIEESFHAPPKHAQGTAFQRDERRPQRDDRRSSPRDQQRGVQRDPQRDQYRDQRNGSHRDPLRQEKRIEQEDAPKLMDTPLFDEKPALSLKDALAKVMQDHSAGSNNVAEKEGADTILQESIKEEASAKRKKEIEEEVLRKLIEE